jgi:hypothetical protein
LIVLPIDSSYDAAFPIESVMREKPFIAVIAHPEGEIYEYLFEGRSRREVKRDVRAWCQRTSWGATIVEIRPSVALSQDAEGHRLLRVAGVTFGVSGITITVAMIIGLSLEGAL